MHKVFRKAGKPDRVATSASEETRFVFDGYTEVKQPADDGSQHLEPKPTAAEKAAAAKTEAEADKQAAESRKTAPKPGPKTNAAGQTAAQGVSNTGDKLSN